MNLFSMLLASIAVLIQDYADYDKAEDYEKTLNELKPDLNFPRIKTYDFIVGECHLFRIQNQTHIAQLTQPFYETVIIRLLRHIRRIVPHALRFYAFAT